MAKDITPQEVKTMTLAVFACTAVVLLVLIIDMRIAKSVVQSAQEFDTKIKDANNGRKADHRVPVGDRFPRSNSVDRVGGNPGMEEGNHDAGVPEELPEESRWDVFPVPRAQ